MSSGKGNHLTKQIGEYLVCAKLGKMGFIATTFTGNVPEFDVLAIDEKYKSKPIQVKTIKEKGDWQLQADQFLDISLTNDMQTINGKKKINNLDLICIFVELRSQDNDKYFIFRLRDLQELIYQKYGKWLGEHGGRRPKKPESMHAGVSPKDLEKYLDNWEIIKEQ